MKITLNVEKCGRYYISKRGRQGCGLCSDLYEEIIGADVVGKVTFILRKTTGKATNCMFRFRDDNLEVHTGLVWLYAKTLMLLNRAFNTDAVVEWAGESMFTIEMEY